MKKNISHTRLTTLNGQEQKSKLQKVKSPFDEALKGLGVSQAKKGINKKQKQASRTISSPV